ncbi:DExH-box ATP-dependent RNA helicase DExH14-like isoform X1 [Zingiber officinale]|uniref:DExH-box ATP-dependent RNA helicase DExH14-like isoform X1 n=1 Tax=Zingiber officinale TaxID=94328 RepID=UPI001C4C6AEF|nr:DExH-box ATP-dependent RNA helicase DExH14-like isoform X1 [Zingiber officinale]
MLVPLPRLTSSFRAPYDVDQAYLRRKRILRNLKSRRANDEPELARKLIPHWDEASAELHQAYRQFVGSVVELVNGEVSSEEFREVAKTAYDLFGHFHMDNDLTKSVTQKKIELQRLIGYNIEDAILQKMASLAQRLYVLQHSPNNALVAQEIGADGCGDSTIEFGSDLSFQVPSRFVLDVPSENVTTLSSDFLPTSAFDDNHYSHTHFANHDSTTDQRTGSLKWLKDACDMIVQHDGASQISGDELAMALCRVLLSNKAGDEIAGDLLDLVGDGSFETVQDLLLHRKELVNAIQHGLFILKSEKISSNNQLKMPSYGTQVIVQTESERQMDKLRRKEEKRNKRLGEYGNTLDFPVESFYSLLLASQKKQPLDDLIGIGHGLNSVLISALPEGTIRLHNSGYEEVRIPPTPTAAMKPHEKLIEIKELDDFAQAAFQGYKSLNRIQSHIYQTTYNTNENILVCAPTGAGKTNIAMISILHEIKQHFRDGFLHKDEFKIVYVAPMKALAAEVTTTFSRRLSPLNLAVRELTGDMQLSKNELEETQMIVTTPEKWDVITRKSSDMSLSMLVKLLIIDEVHLLNDDRGPVIEALVARTLRQVESTQSMIRIVGLSATLPNYLEVGQFLHVNPDNGLFFFDSSYRPVPLAQQYIGITEKDFYKKNALFNSICYEKVLDSIKQGHQAMVFVHSRKDTGKTARTLNELALNSGDLELFGNDTHPQFALIKKEVSKSRNRELVELFESGFGIHHAGMLRSDRALTERLFSDGLLKVLVCTATLAWGVNLPAHTVIIKGTQLYDPKAGGWRDLGMLDVMQIFGRAGRPQFDKSGEGIILTTHDKLAYYLRLLTSQLPIESQFINSMKDNLNAEVVLGTVTNIKEACAWLGYTYLFIRMKTNPLVYGIPWDEVIADPSLVSKQRSLITDAARALDKAKMMRFDEKSGNFYCTELGRIASHFYLQYSSVETYNEMLRRHMSDSEVINMVAHSSEFENIVVREEEQDELENLFKMLCPLEVKGGPTDKHGKIAILIQVYISRGSIESFSLISDAAYISASLGRIMRALFEICLRRGWCEMSALMLQYCKAVDLQIWPHQHPLRQFERDLSAAVLKKLEERGTDLDHLFEMEEKDISALIRYAPGGKLVKQYLSYFPIINLSATVSPITRTVLKVDLLITPEFNWKDRFHGTSKRWWILVEDSENDHIYHSELFTLTKRMARPEPQKLSFTVPIFEPHPPQYYIRAVSDSWLHAESLYTVSFHNLTLPEMQISHTELLDLKPLPVGSLGNKTYKNLYKFSHFNPIQTQAFHVLYHLDNNVLLGAPTGSGKTISAELAMLHLFDTQPDMKVVYIAPLKAIVRERMNDWKRRLVSPLGKKMVEMTGDFTPDLMALLSADIIISTPEKWDGISRSWKNRSYVMKVGLMILDEIHLLGADRGPILEVIVSRMRYISSQTARSIRFVGLSTALANACDLASWLGVEENGLFNFKPSVRPVPLEVHIQGYPGKFYCPRMNSMNKPAYAAICTHSPTKPVLIFVSSRRQTRLTALDLIQLAASDESPRKFLNMPEESLEMILSQITDNNLRHTLQFGIGLHHAGLNDRDRSLVEELFSNNKIQILVCTSTLAWGVNLPAHLVIIKGTEYYDGKAKRYVDFPITDILQMMGRAGRPQYDQHGKAVILVHEPKKSFYKKFLYEPFPVESNLREHLHDHINAEVVSGTISHKEDAVHYLTWTFLFRRLVLNPSYYGLEDTDANTLNSFLSSLVLNTFEVLEDSGCIKINENSVEPLMLGSIASQYYLSYRTVSMFGANIGPDTSLETFLGILSAASEFDELPVRHNEENHNKALSEKVPYMVDERRLDDPHVKANLLFQAHFSRIELPITDYVTDLKSVLDQSIRIIQAMIDISANSGWLSSTMTCMHLLQMIMQGLWYGNESSLWMLPCMNKDLLSHLKNIGISSLQDLLELPKEKFNQKLQKFATDLYKDLQHFPRIRVRVKLQYRDGKASEPEALNIRLEKINSKHSRAFVPRYPKVKNEAWWLVLGNITSSELYALKRVSFSGQTFTRMELPPSKINFQETKLFLVSDCYVGYEQECPIEIS